MTQALLRRVCLSAVIGAMAFAWADAGWSAAGHSPRHPVVHHHHRRFVRAVDPLPAVREFLATFTQRQAAEGMVDVSLVEEVPPRTWSGPGALQAWSVSLQQAGGVDSSANLHASARADRGMAYVLAPVLYSYERRGAVVVQPAIIAISLHSEGAGWKISGWAWAGANPQASQQATGPYLPAG
jgi:hypothetical protein